MSGRFDELADRLEVIGDELADVAIDEIRSAIRAGQRTPPTVEKRITQARRAIEKAVHLLRAAEQPSPSEFDPD